MRYIQNGHAYLSSDALVLRASKVGTRIEIVIIITAVIDMPQKAGERSNDLSNFAQCLVFSN